MGEPVMGEPVMGEKAGWEIAQALGYTTGDRVTAITIDTRVGDLASVTVERLLCDREVSDLVKVLERYQGGEAAGPWRAQAASDLRRRRRRNAVSDERIALAAETYERHGIDAVARTLGVGERQAWRYVQRAIDAGLTQPRVRR